MNRFMKRCLITGIVLVVAGGSISAAAASFGASIWDIVPNEVPRWKNTLSAFPFDEIDYEYDNVDFPELDFDEPEEAGQEIYSTDKAKSLKAEIRAGKVFIKEDATVSKLTIYSNKKDGNWLIEEEDGELKLKAGGRLNANDTDLVMTICVPEGYRFSDVDLEVSMKKGMLKRDGNAPIVACRSLSADDMNLEVKAGALLVDKGNVNDLNIECSAGAVEYNGITTGDINGECKVGALRLMLSGKKEDYNYDIQCKLGAVKIADEQMATLASGDNWNYSAGKNMNLECSAGAIEVGFYQ